MSNIPDWMKEDAYLVDSGILDRAIEQSREDYNNKELNQ